LETTAIQNTGEPVQATRGGVMEIYEVMSGVPAKGKSEEALQSVIKLAKYFNETYSKYVKTEIISNVDGKEKLHWIVRHKSWAAFEELDKIYESDPKKKGFEREMTGLFDSGETHYYKIVT
jgi:hypothetical protein